jgi:hypothetical protein
MRMMERNPCNRNSYKQEVISNVEVAMEDWHCWEIDHFMAEGRNFNEERQSCSLTDRFDRVTPLQGSNSSTVSTHRFCDVIGYYPQV